MNDALSAANAIFANRSMGAASLSPQTDVDVMCGIGADNVHHIEPRGRTRINIGAERRRSVAKRTPDGSWDVEVVDGRTECPPHSWKSAAKPFDHDCWVELSHGDESCTEWADARVPGLDRTASADVRRDDGGVA